MWGQPDLSEIVGPQRKIGLGGKCLRAKGAIRGSYGMQESPPSIRRVLGRLLAEAAVFSRPSLALRMDSAAELALPWLAAAQHVRRRTRAC
jgi:hypothetical protein